MGVIGTVANGAISGTKKVVKWGGIAALGVGSASAGIAHKTMGSMHHEIDTFASALSRWISTRLDITDFEQMWATSDMAAGNRRDGLSIAAMSSMSEMYGPQAGG